MHVISDRFLFCWKSEFTIRRSDRVPVSLVSA